MTAWFGDVVAGVLSILECTHVLQERPLYHVLEDFHGQTVYSQQIIVNYIIYTLSNNQ